MSIYRKNPLFAIAITLCGVLVVGEMALIYERYAASRDAARRLAQRRTDLESMTVLMPPPTREVASAVEADLAKAQLALTAMQGELKGRAAAAERIRTSKAPGARTDAYFDLATFVEKSRAAAAQNEVEVRPEAARFGFSSFANEGPMPDHIEAVFRQRQIAQYLVDALIEARPRAIFSVKREATISKADREARAAAVANGETPPEIHSEEGPDFFAIDPRVTARVPGFIDTIPFRFVFTGQTAALRSFLNRLASFELPVLVREVEVEQATAEEISSAPVTEEAAATAAAAVDTAVAASVVLTADEPAPRVVAPKAVRPPRASASTPIVAKTISKFTVTVEFVELVPPAAAAAPADAAPEPAPVT